MKKSILILNTGGTISMQQTATGHKPVLGLLPKLLADMVALKHPAMPTVDIHEYQPLIDSSNLTPAIWNQLATDIQKNYQQYDGFLILHGTDTMAYTASALSFMLENLDKPVILTGSQIPLTDVRTDARQNLIDALYIASHYELNEVCLYFHDFLLRGNRCKKMSSTRYTAFESPNFPPLAVLEKDIHWQTEQLLQKTAQAFNPVMMQDITIGNVKLFPGISFEHLAQLFEQPLHAVIIGTYGLGNAPSDDAFLASLKKANERGIVLINCTQCPHGYTDMQTYAAGHSLADLGMISAADMTMEAVIAKLYYLFSCGWSVTQVKEKMQENLRGELTSFT